MFNCVTWKIDKILRPKLESLTKSLDIFFNCNGRNSYFYAILLHILCVNYFNVFEVFSCETQGYHRHFWTWISKRLQNFPMRVIKLPCPNQHPPVFGNFRGLGGQTAYAHNLSGTLSWTQQTTNHIIPKHCALGRCQNSPHCGDILFFTELYSLHEWLS